MLTDIVWDLGASAVNLRWYVFGALIATAVCQDVFNAAYLFWNRPVSPSCKAIDLDIELYPAWDSHSRPFNLVRQMVEQLAIYNWCAPAYRERLQAGWYRELQRVIIHAKPDGSQIQLRLRYQLENHISSS